jgi:hypothetical protein
MAGNGNTSMIGKPDWLPPMLKLSGTWEEIVSSLYAIFDKDFKQGKPRFQDYIVWWDQRILNDQYYEEGFWHLISRDDKNTGQRIPDFRRAERLPWCAPTITHSYDNTVKVWNYQEGEGKIRTYLWLEEYDYCIIIEKRKNVAKKVAMLITAFYVDGPSRKRNLRNKLARKVP